MTAQKLSAQKPVAARIRKPQRLLVAARIKDLRHKILLIKHTQAIFSAKHIRHTISHSVMGG
jgi:hypothetical protein